MVRCADTRGGLNRPFAAAIVASGFAAVIAVVVWNRDLPAHDELVPAPFRA